MDQAARVRSFPRGKARVKVLWGMAALGMVALLWAFAQVQDPALQAVVPTWVHLPWLETPYAYFLLHLFTIGPVFLLSFDKKVHFYREWKYLFPAIGIVAVFFLVWDEYFTAISVWGFNPDYLSGYYLFDLPVEECLFFFTVPYACVFIYECLQAYLAKDPVASFEKPLSIGLLVVFFLVGITHLDHLYTGTTFLLCTVFQAFHMLYHAPAWRSRFYLSFLIALLPFFLVNGALTGAFTRSPIVMYNPGEFLGLRIGSVPADDIAYGYLLLFACTTGYEYFRRNSVSSQPG